MRMRRHCASWIVVVLAAMAQTLAAPAHAQSCSVTITDMSFGAVDTLAGAPTQSEATIGYNCTGEGSERVLICVYLGAGSVPASGSRQM